MSKRGGEDVYFVGLSQVSFHAERTCIIGDLSFHV